MVHTTGTRWARAAITLAGAVNRCCACTRSIWSSRITSPSQSANRGQNRSFRNQFLTNGMSGAGAENAIGRKTVEFLLLCGRSASQPWPDDRQFVPVRAQAARQLVGAPATAAADGGKDVGRNQQAHRIQTGLRCSSAASIAAERRSQWRSQP